MTLQKIIAPRLAALIIGLSLVAGSGCADARGGGGHGFGHGFGHGGGLHSASLAGDRAHANDAYAKAALQEEEKLLAKLKNICRGC